MEYYKTPTKPVRSFKKTIKIPPSPMMQKLGYGTGVAVYRMNRSPISNKHQSPWALKKLLQHSRSKVLEERLKEEADTLRQLKHPNVVGFRAHIRLKDGTSCLAMEDCSASLGDLIERRFEDGAMCFESHLIVKVASDLASALKYLHDEALLLHCDIKSYNVLIKGAFEVCKLCDFGVSLPLKMDGCLDESKVDPEVEYIGTLPWCAPEVLGGKQVITVKADVYAYGIVIWEMLALTTPPEPESGWIPDGDANDSTGGGSFEPRQRPDVPDFDFDEDYNLVLELFYLCTDVEYEKRPTAGDLYTILH